jgi:hypothetical protein
VAFAGLKVLTDWPKTLSVYSRAAGDSRSDGKEWQSHRSRSGHHGAARAGHNAVPVPAVALPELTAGVFDGVYPRAASEALDLLDDLGLAPLN